MDFPHGVTVTVRSVTTTDDGLGNTTETTTESAWGPCAVAPRYATESTDPRVPPVIVGKTVYGPPTMKNQAGEVVPLVLNAADELILPSGTYQVDGKAGEWFGEGANPFTGWEPGAEVPIKRAATV